MPVYYAMESVRDQIHGVCEARPLSGLPDTWNRYPCHIEEKCKAAGRQSCVGYVEIMVNDPQSSIVILEILFLRLGRRAFIQGDNLNLDRLIRLGHIDPSRLVAVAG